MPLYEYHCNDCGEEFQKIVTFAEASQSQTCPECQGQDTKKKISTIAARLGASIGTSFSTGGSCNPRGGFS